MRRPLSMTGFGRGEASGSDKKWTVEVRSVNHRFLDVKIKMPRRYSFFEERIKKRVSMFYSRGHVDVSMDVVDEGEEGGRLKIDLALAREYYRGLQTIRNELQLQQEPDLNMLAAFRDIILPTEEVLPLIKIDEIWPAACAALDSALDEAASMRAEEGMAMKKDLQEPLVPLWHGISALSSCHNRSQVLLRLSGCCICLSWFSCLIPVFTSRSPLVTQHG